MRLDSSRWLVLFAAAVLSFGEAFNTTTLSIFAVPIKQRYGINNEDLGLLFGTRKAMCVVSPILAGIAIRRFGTQAVFVIGAALMVLATLIETAAFSVLKQYGWLFAGAVLTTASYSAAQIAYYTAFAQRFRGGELALAFALDYAAYMLGLAVCGVAAPQFLDVATNNFSRAFVVTSSLASSGLLIGIWIWIKVPEQREATAGSACHDIMAGFLHFAKLSRVAYLVISFTVVWLCAYDDIKYFFSDYLQTVLRVNLDDAARLFALAGVTAAVIGPLLGLIYDRVGRMPLFLFISSCVLVPSSVIYLFNAQLGLLNTRSHMALLIAAIVCMAVAEVSQKTIAQVFLVRVLPIAHFSVLQGCIVALTNACVAITFIIVGTLTKRDPSYTNASALIETLVGVLLLLSVAILFVDVRGGAALSIAERERDLSSGDPDRVDHAGSGASASDGRRSSRGGVDSFDDEAGEEDKLVRH